jgi:hypothetical protein
MRPLPDFDLPERSDNSRNRGKPSGAVNPVPVLKGLGAKASSWQDVETLQCERIFHVEKAATPIIVTFSYPVFIAR